MVYVKVKPVSQFSFAVGVWIERGRRADERVRPVIRLGIATRALHSRRDQLGHVERFRPVRGRLAEDGRRRGHRFV